MLEAIYSAYFEKSEPVFTADDLVPIAERVGVSESEVRSILATDAFADQVHEDQNLARELGASGVPFFVFDMKYGISGAQPQEVFTETIRVALAERRPA